MAKKVLVIPDVHGETFWKGPVYRYIDLVDKIVFLGDYLDSYPTLHNAVQLSAYQSCWGAPFSLFHMAATNVMGCSADEMAGSSSAVAL